MGLFLFQFSTFNSRRKPSSIDSDWHRNSFSVILNGACEDSESHSRYCRSFWNLDKFTETLNPSYCRVQGDRILSMGLVIWNNWLLDLLKANVFRYQFMFVNIDVWRSSRISRTTMKLLSQVLDLKTSSTSSDWHHKIKSLPLGGWGCLIMLFEIKWYN